MENKQIPKREEKLWSEIKNYQVATNNARILGVLDELIINEKTGKIVDIAIRIESDRNIHVKKFRLWTLRGILVQKTFERLHTGIRAISS